MKQEQSNAGGFTTEVDVDLDEARATLAGLRIAVIGYGNQGRAQALNLRDSGGKVRIGNIDDAYAQMAREDGFEVLAIAEAVKEADVAMILLPDEVAPAVLDRQICPAMRPRCALCFASGYVVAFDEAKLRDDCDVLLLAPRMIGRGVRDRFLSSEGFFSLAGVERDISGRARAVLIALAFGIGTLKRGILQSSCRMEAELDLFNEQAFGPAFGRVLLGSMQTLLAAGYPPEAVLLEIYLSGELSYICNDMAQHGLIGQLKHHSPTSQYGAISRGIKFLGVNVKRPMRKVLDNIRNGGFAREWRHERLLGQPRFRLLRAIAVRQPIGRLEAAIRRKLGIGQPRPAVGNDKSADLT